MDKEDQYYRIFKKSQKGGGNWMKAVKMYKLSVIRYIGTKDVMYDMINIMNTAVCYI